MDWRLRRSEDVQQVQQNLVGALNNSVNNTEAIELLEQLKETLETQENQFYATLSCDLPTLQKNYQTAHSYLTSLQSGVISLENQCVEAFSKKGLGVDKEQLVKEFLKVINNQIPTVFSGHVPKAETFVKDLMREGLGADASGRINFRQKSAMGRMDKVGLGVLELVMNYKGETNPVQVVMKKDSNYQLIDHKTIKLIQDYLHLAIERLPLDKKAFEEFVLERVSNQVVREIVVEGLREGSIAINRSEASIRGFFGEVYAKAALYSLFRTKNVFKAVHLTGTFRKTSSQQEIPIDTVLETVAGYYNFQVKNYKFGSREVVRIKNTTNAMAFIDNRLYLQSSSMSRLLMEFFASYQYNQPFSFESKKQGIMSVSEYRDTVYKEFQNIFHENLRPVFDANVGNILKVQDVFSTGALPFQKQTMYYNHFFIVKDRIIPSSKIIQQIINSLKTEKPLTTYTLRPPKNKRDVLEQFLYDPNYYPPINYLAQQPQIYYSVGFSIKLDF